LLDDGISPGLGQCVQLMRVSKGPLGVDVMLGDGLHLQVKAMLPCPCHRPHWDRRPLEHAGPQLELPMLVSKVLTFTAQDMLNMRQGPVSHAHGLPKGMSSCA
jgi:hypothetical protein